MIDTDEKKKKGTAIISEEDYYDYS